VQRAGEVVVQRGFGLANREKKIPNRPNTVFGTGSLPIDYTRAALLLLVDAGIVSLGDPLDEYFDEVPADKRAITVGMLTNGASGLQDFHGRPEDRDPDHHWISRDEAVRRILEDELLFAPGSGRRHSHSAWGLVAAIVEIASGQSYRDFLDENFFEPLGMQDTGFYGDPIPFERMAVARGEFSDGEINAPPYWGPTSWLVLGSGGMTSTIGDMARWLNGMRTAGLLSAEAARSFWSPPGSLAKAGSVYGFEVWYIEGPDTFFILFTNDSRGGLRRRGDRLAEDLMRLCVR
jgi:CubicO group peptidase (beta-lactamase class C family)